VRASSECFIDKHVQDNLTSNHITISAISIRCEGSVLSTPEVSVAILGDTLIGAALVSAEWSNELLGTEVVAMVASS